MIVYECHGFTVMLLICSLDALVIVIVRHFVYVICKKGIKKILRNSQET